MPPARTEGKPREAVLMRATAVRLLMLWSVAISSCGDEPIALPGGLPAHALPGMEADSEVLGIEALASDALDRAVLERLLREAGYVGGRQRTFSGPGERFSLAVTRILVFDSAGGASRYLSWLRTHPRDLLGTAELLPPPPDLPASAFLMAHVPGGCCPKEVPIYVSAWRRGDTVLFVRASGRQADRGAVEALTVRLDGTLPDVRA
jgi:hypothetical protein